MELLAIFTFGVLIGSLTTRVLFKKKKIGTLRVDHSDPDSGPYLFLEIDSGKSHLISSKKFILLDVNTNGYLPQD